MIHNYKKFTLLQSDIKFMYSTDIKMVTFLHANCINAITKPSTQVTIKHSTFVNILYFIIQTKKRTGQISNLLTLPSFGWNSEDTNKEENLKKMLIIY